MKSFSAPASGFITKCAHRIFPCVSSILGSQRRLDSFKSNDTDTGRKLFTSQRSVWQQYEVGGEEKVTSCGLFVSLSIIWDQDVLLVWSSPLATQWRYSLIDFSKRAAGVRTRACCSWDSKKPVQITRQVVSPSSSSIRHPNQMSILVLQVMKPYGLVGGYQNFGGTYCFYFQGVDFHGCGYDALWTCR